MNRKIAVLCGLVMLAAAMLACATLPFGGVQEAVESAKEAAETAQPLALTAAAGAPEMVETMQPLALTAAASAPELLETAQPAAATAAAEAQEELGEVSIGENTSPFPVPEGAENVMTTESLANFQVKMTLEAAMQYYRDQLGAQGLTERADLTSAEGGTFSMVFDGGPEGKSVVVQGVALGELMNINVRYEEMD
ncbi:MAG: hypothetical protein GYA48_09375 [Chloroflexi bacterium]|nr:hypothetical protein [Chloroflexota bacterium]